MTTLRNSYLHNMDTMNETITQINDWVIDRMHYLCDGKRLDIQEDYVQKIDNAFAIQQEFREWFDADRQEEVLSIEYSSDWD